MYIFIKMSIEENTNSDKRIFKIDIYIYKLLVEEEKQELFRSFV